MIKESLHYKDVVLNNPIFSTVKSRNHLSSNITFLECQYKSIAIPANMKTAISFDMAKTMDSENYFYILHRFYDYDEIYNWCKITDLNTVSISVGVKPKDYFLIDKLSSLNKKVTHITIDVAFGHSSLVKRMIKNIRKKIPDVKIIAGNVCTPEACSDLAEWGADAAKVGLSMGKSCLTYNMTGVGSPMFSTILNCSKNSPIPIIADGGIREIGDYSKAMVAGATLVMVGSEFVKCIDSPAEWKDKNNKIYFGSASKKNKGKDVYVEGSDEVILLTNNLTYSQYINKINQGVRSCMSYHNLRDVCNMHMIEWSKHTI